MLDSSTAPTATGVGSAPHSPRVLALADHLGHADGRVHGATTYYATVYPRLVRAGIDLTVCFMGSRHSAVERLEREGIKPLFLGRARWDPRALVDVLRLIEERDIEVVHAAAFKSHILGRLAAAVNSRRAIIHLHDTVPIAPPIRFALRRLASRTDLALAVSDPVGRFGIEQYGLDARQVRTLHNAIDLSPRRADPAEARASLRTELGVPDDSRLIGLIGRLAPMKGHEYAIRALPAVLEACPGARLVFCGEGAELENLASVARALNVEAAVIFAGQRSDVPRVLAALDVVVMPSMFGEGLPYAAIEAIAAGRAIVAFPTAGIPEVVPHGEAGLLVPAGDVEALAEALIRVLLDHDLRARLEAGATRHARQFGLEQHVDELVAIYRELTGAG